MSRRKHIGSLALICSATLAFALPLHPTAVFSQAGIVDVPLTGAALAHAQAAFAAYDRKDYDTAISEVREALRQRPDVVRLKRLLVYALRADGQLQAAADAAKGFIAAGDRDPEIAAELAQIEATLNPPPPTPEALAYEAAAAAYKAYAEHDYAGAVAAARKALDLQPANAEYQTLLGNAEAALKMPPPAAPPPGYVAAQAAYAAMKTKAYSRAAVSAAEAVRLAPANRAYRVLLVQALAGAGEPELAIARASAALRQFGPDPLLLAERGYAEQHAGRPAAAADDFAAALAHRPKADSVRGLRLALADAALDAGEPERVLAALAPLHDDGAYDVASRRGFALLALKRPDEALAAFRLAAAAATPADRAQIAGGEISALADLGNKAEAKAVLTRSLEAGTFAGTPPTDIAYMALQAGDDRLASDAFAKAQAAGTLPAKANLDAGYSATRLAENATAISYFKAALDAAATDSIALDPQAQFAVRRQISDMDRTWGAYLSVLYGAVGVMPSTPANTIGPAPTGQNSSDRVAQVGTEIYWRPPEIGYRDGSIVEVFTRAFETIYDENGGATGAPTLQGYAGIRWKPIGAINLFLEASRLWALGDDARNDYLLRAAYSTGQGTDLRVDTTSWTMWQIYGEADRYFETPETVLSFEGRLGRSFRFDGLADGLVVTPFAALGGGYDSLLATPGAVGAGPGVSARLWFNGDTYHAPRSYLDVSVQYRFRIAGGDNARGVFAGMTLAY